MCLTECCLHLFIAPSGISKLSKEQQSVTDSPGTVRSYSKAKPLKLTRKCRKPGETRVFN